MDQKVLHTFNFAVFNYTCCVFHSGGGGWRWGICGKLRLFCALNECQTVRVAVAVVVDVVFRSASERLPLRSPKMLETDWVNEGAPLLAPAEPDFVILIEGSEFALKSWVYLWCIWCHRSWHGIGCTEDKHNFWRQIWYPQLKGRGLCRTERQCKPRFAFISVFAQVLAHFKPLLRLLCVASRKTRCHRHRRRSHNPR